jgi:hypothetical protein
VLFHATAQVDLPSALGDPASIVPTSLTQSVRHDLGNVRLERVEQGVVAVPVFLIERRFAEDIEASAEVADRINRINSLPRAFQ